jgi:hypothetical protein
MENNDKTFAIIEDGIVVNAIVGPVLAIVQGLLPDADLVEVTEQTGNAFIDGPYVDGVFLPTSPFESWVMDVPNKSWKAPIDEPALEPGFFNQWNEETLSWDSQEIVVLTESE